MPDYSRNPNQTPQSYLKVISIIHLALFAGQTMFAIVAFFLVGKTQIDIKNNNDPLLFLVPILAIGGFIASNLMFKQQLNSSTNRDALKDKLMGYQTELIIRFALLEAPSLFGIGSYLLTGNFLFLIISGLLMLYFISIRPTRVKIENDLNLTYDEKTAFSGL
ncbi:MAG: hypothetical protein ACXVAY_04760 [Mucilaginibacter sp.]